MGVKTVPFDAAPYLGDPIAQVELLDDALQSGDASYIDHALSVIAKARGLSNDGLSQPASREPGSRTRPDGKRDLASLLSITRELGLQLHIRSADAK